MTGMFQMRILILVVFTTSLAVGVLSQSNNKAVAQKPTPISIPDEKTLEIPIITFEGDIPKSIPSLAQERLDEIAQHGYPSFVTWKEADLTGDGKSEFILATKTPSLWHMSFTILQHVSNDEWHELYDLDTVGRYGPDYNITVDGQRLMIDMVITNGGTGRLQTEWKQLWIECDVAGCVESWSGTIMSTETAYTHTSNQGASSFAVSEIIKQGTEQIQVETKRLNIQVQYSSRDEDDVVVTAQKTIGPNTIIVYERQGLIFEPVQWQTKMMAQVINREFDYETQYVNTFVDWLSHHKSRDETGKIDHDSFMKSKSELLGIPVEANLETNIKWNTKQGFNTAAHNGSPSKLGVWIAGLIQAENEPLCRLTVHRHENNTLTKVGHLDIPCLANFSQLAWIELTGDGPPELLLKTLHPHLFERLYIYSMEAPDLVELATLDGYLNGTDGSGLDWHVTPDGLIIQTQVSWLNVNETGSYKLIKANMDKGIQTYLWDVDSRSFVGQ